jgi:hypothetical protein
MANSTSGNPWKIDTAGVISTKPVYVHHMSWTPEADGDDISVIDNGSNDLWSLKALVGDANQSIELTRTFETQLNGINVSTLDSGTLYVFIR